MIVQIFRGGKIESQHLIDAIVVDSNAREIATFGDATANVFPRSSIKPIQALAFVMSEAHKELSQPHKSIAIACASHSAQQIHLDYLRYWHQELGIRESELACGPQPPDDQSTAEELVLSHNKPGRIHNNCSGKHTAMLATCRALGWPLNGYEKWDHPLQEEIRKYLSLLSGVDHNKAAWATDGCGLPTYYLPLTAVARMMSALLRPDSFDQKVSSALKLIRKACTEEPWMIGGTESLCSQIGFLTGGRVFAKVGAEGNYSAVFYDSGIAIALKAKDGAFRACEAALYALIERFANLDTALISKIHEHALPPIKNWAGQDVGSIQIQI